MIVRFGLSLQEQIFPLWEEGIDYSCGPQQLIEFLEEQLGIGYPDNKAFLRVEQYRQLLALYLEKHKEAFFAASFSADPLATAQALLDRRDELYLSSWDFAIRTQMPSRLRTLAELERLLQRQEEIQLAPAFAERFRQVFSYIEKGRKQPISKLLLQEAETLWPPYWQRFFELMKQEGVLIENLAEPQPLANKQLGQLQARLLGQEIPKANTKKADGSILVLKAESEAYAAAYLAKLFAQMPDLKPLCLLSNKNRALDNALVQEGLPSFGVESASLARPSLQILKLISSFLWQPLNPYRLLEFLSLPNIPLHKGLAVKLAESISEKPGLFSALWFRKKEEFVQDMKAQIERAGLRIAKKLEAELAQAEKDYSFWFERRRYDSRQLLPVRELVEIFDYLRLWALKLVDEQKKQLDKIDKKLNKSDLEEAKEQQLERQREEVLAAQKPILRLYEQAGRLLLLLQSLAKKEQGVGYLQLERLVKQVNQAVAIPFRPSELGHAPFVYEPAAIVGDSPQLLWWNFVDPQRNIGFERWYKQERAYLEKRAIELETLSQINLRNIWQRIRPILYCREQLILVLPTKVEGREQHPHPLWGDMQALFGDLLDSFSIQLEEAKNSTYFQQYFELAQEEKLRPSPLKSPSPYIRLGQQEGGAGLLSERKNESFSSLDKLFYYPYQWVFRYLIGLNKSSILQVSSENRLKGNLSHVLFERLFDLMVKKPKTWSKTELEAWIDKTLPTIIEREGAVLLMYGKEADRISFINKMKFSAWTLISAIQRNGWSVKASEMAVEGELCGQKIKGIADLVLYRERNGQAETAVLDLKWKGKSFYRQSLQNNDDLQLVVYSKFLSEQEGQWAHSGYYIISEGIILSRNNQAFAEAEAVSPEIDAIQQQSKTWQEMENTYLWRMQQLQEGQIELRNEHTQSALEEILQSQGLLDLLEMRQASAKYDIYRVLVQPMA